MKKLTFTLMALAITTLTFSQAISINGGINRSMDEDDSFKAGLSLGVSGEFVNFSIGKIPCYVPLEVQYSAGKAWGADEKYVTSDIGTGLYLTSEYAELGFTGGLSINRLPDYGETDGYYLATIEYDLGIGYYVGINGIIKYPFNDQLAVFLLGRIAYKSFNSDYNTLYYDVNENLITENGTYDLNLLHSIVSLGLKYKL